MCLRRPQVHIPHQPARWLQSPGEDARNSRWRLAVFALVLLGGGGGVTDWGCLLRTLLVLLASPVEQGGRADAALVNLLLRQLRSR